jgi:predicted nucleotidyltransferase
MDKIAAIVDKVKAYKALVLQNSPMRVERVYLFGSYAKGTPHKDSDIDVAFVVKHFTGNYFEVIPPIWALRRQVDSRIEPHVIARDEDYAEFIDEIENTGVAID